MATIQPFLDELAGLDADLGELLTAMDAFAPLFGRAVPGDYLQLDAELTVSGTLASLLTGATGQVMVTRTPALSSLLVALPRGIGQLGSIEHGGVADFDLVAAQGPVRYYPNTRRPPTNTTSREPVLDYHRPADMPGLQQRRAANAPRPGVPAAPQVTAYDPATRTTVGPDGVPFTIGTSGGQNAVLGLRSWYALLLQGAS